MICGMTKKTVFKSHEAALNRGGEIIGVTGASGQVDDSGPRHCVLNPDRSGRIPADHIEASIIDTRLRQAESRLREQALER